jgi:hypothetical protein
MVTSDLFNICVYKRLRYVILLTSWNKFRGMPMEAPCDSSIMRAACRGYIQRE